MGAATGQAFTNGPAPRVGRCPGRRGADQRIRIASRNGIERSSHLVRLGPPLSHRASGESGQDAAPGECGQTEAHPASFTETALVRLGPTPRETDRRSRVPARCDPVGQPRSDSRSGRRGRVHGVDPQAIDRDVEGMADPGRTQPLPGGSPLRRGHPPRRIGSERGGDDAME